MHIVSYNYLRESLSLFIYKICVYLLFVTYKAIIHLRIIKLYFKKKKKMIIAIKVLFIGIYSFE